MIEPMEEVPAPNCEVCHRDPGSDPEYGGCICPECRICGVVGDPKCWREHFPSAPQAQEEPSGAPAPGGMCPHCLHNMELVARTAERIKYLEDVERKFEAHVCPQPPAPASPEKAP